MPSVITRAVRLEAVKLRKQGKTYGQIRKQLGISKSMLSYWSKKIILSPQATDRLKRTQNLHLQKARLSAQSTLKIKQAEFLDGIRKKLTPLITKTLKSGILKVALAFLYLGEGAKWKSHRGLQLGSSDPIILLLYIKLLKKCYFIDKSKLRCYICYRADQSLGGLMKYWSKILSIPTDNFYRSSYDKRTAGKPTKNKEYKGVCVVSCAGTEIQHELDLITKMLNEGL